jgi:hypothetical protein
LQNNNDFYGHNNVWFTGVVREVIDEVYVRVRIFGVHPIDMSAVSDNDLPPALVAYPVTGGQVGSGASTHNLTVDSWVIGFFADWPYCQQPIVTSVIQGTDYSMSTYGSGGGEFVGQGNPNDSSGENEGTDGIDSGATTNIPGGSNVQKTYNYITTKLNAEGSSNDPHLHASAMCGVLMLETPGINPAVVGGYKGRAWGICQWLGDRRSSLFRKFGRTKRLDQQLDFAWWELNGYEKRAKNLWLSSSNLPDAVAGFCMFERAEEVRNGRVVRSHGNYKKRLQYAYQVYNSLKQTGTAQATAPRIGGTV